LNARGTLLIASSVSVKMVGTAMKPSRMPAVRMLRRSLNGAKTDQPVTS
jgi:hypothetical protein